MARAGAAGPPGQLAVTWGREVPGMTKAGLATQAQREVWAAALSRT